MVEDDWTTKTTAELTTPGARSTNPEVNVAYKDKYVEDQPEDRQQQGRTAKSGAVPGQPTQQERAEGELTRVPYESWCPTCVANKG